MRVHEDVYANQGKNAEDKERDHQQGGLVPAPSLSQPLMEQPCEKPPAQQPDYFFGITAEQGAPRKVSAYKP